MSINRGMDKENMVHVWNGILVIKKKEIMTVAAIWMALESIILSEVSHRRRNLIWHTLYVESKKKWYNELMYKTETDSQTSRINLWLLGERIEGGTVREFGMDMYSLLYLKWITYKDILYSTCKSALCYLTAWMGGEFGENGYKYMYIWVPSLFTGIYYNIVY